ncbi:MAG: hypothetical protein AAGG01_20640, partial [Planctomycetota bacterium]
AGAVRVVDCLFERDSIAGAYFFLASDVTIHRSAIAGGIGNSAAGTSGVLAFDSRLTIWNSSIAAAGSYYGYPGRAGLVATRSDIFLHGCSVRGGRGSNSFLDEFSCSPARDGGSGIYATGPETIHVLDTVPVPGEGGSGSSCSTEPGESGSVIAGDAPMMRHPGESLDLDSPYLATEGTSVTVTASGAAGDIVLLGVGPMTRAQHLPAYVGDLFVSGPAGTPRRLLMGSGPTAELSLNMPELPPMAIEHLYLQSLHLREGRVVAGPVRPLIVLDSGW